jgi:hypothetical protein
MHAADDVDHSRETTSMRCHLLAVLPAVATMLAACSDSSMPTAARAPDAPSRNAAVAIRTAQTMPFAQTVQNPCSPGTDIALTGEMRFTSQLVINNRRRSIDIDVSGKADGTDATGRAYQFMMSIGNSIHVELTDEPGSYGSTARYRLVSQGGTDNLAVDLVFHVTVNANGDLSPFVDRMTSACRG